MAEGISDNYLLEEEEFDFYVQNKPKHRLKKSRNNSDKSSDGEDNKTKLIESLSSIGIPSSAKTLLTKIINNGQLTSIDKVLLRNKKSIILSGKVIKNHRDFPTLSSDDVIIKIHINGEKDELWKRANDESKDLLKPTRQGINKPTYLLHSGNIVIMTMIGSNGVPAPNLEEVLRASNKATINSIYRKFFKYWCLVREKNFEPTNFVYAEGQWWSVGVGTSFVSDYSENHENKLLHHHRCNLKMLLDLFLRYKLTIKEARDGFLQNSDKNFDWYLYELTRGTNMTKRSVFSLLYKSETK